MTTQPEALRLADALEVRGFLGTTASDAAAELRRLHKEIGDWDRVCDQHLKHIDKLKQRMKRAEALNQELLEALKLAMLDWENMRVVPSASRAHKAARAAIAKVEGQA